MRSPFRLLCIVAIAALAAGCSGANQSSLVPTQSGPSSTNAARHAPVAASAEQRAAMVARLNAAFSKQLKANDFPKAKLAMQPSAFSLSPPNFSKGGVHTQASNGGNNGAWGYALSAGSGFTGIEGFNSLYPGQNDEVPVTNCNVAFTYCVNITPLPPQNNTFLAMPVNFPPGGSCLVTGSAYTGKNPATNPPPNGTHSLFLITDLCHSFTIALQYTWKQMLTLGYVTPASLPNPFQNEYAVQVYTTDQSPSATSVWNAALYNWNTGTWDQVFSTTGLGSNFFGAAAWLQFPFKAGFCPPLPENTIGSFTPSGLQMFSNDIHLFNPFTQSLDELQSGVNATWVPPNPNVLTCFLPQHDGHDLYIASQTGVPPASNPTGFQENTVFDF